MAEKDDNPFGLSIEERRVLLHWQKGDSMATAYKKVMLSVFDSKLITQSALNQRINRFFDTYRMRQAMAASPGMRGERAKKDLERWKQKHNKETVVEALGSRKVRQTRIMRTLHAMEDVDREIVNNSFAPPPRGKFKKKLEKLDDEIPDDVKEGKPFVRTEFYKTDKDAWLESLNIKKDPSAMTIYGTGQFVMYVAVKEIMNRQSEIRRLNKSPLDKNGSAFTPNIISALKTAAAMILPFAPAPTLEDKQGMTRAAVLLGLLPDEIEESPDDYTAPIPPTAEINREEDEEYAEIEEEEDT